MDEEYDSFIWSIAQREKNKPPEERNPEIAQAEKMRKWWNRRRAGLPPESVAEKRWRENFDPSQ